METKLEYMKRVCNELDVALTDVTTKALHIADELGISKGEDMGPAEVLITLRHQISVGEAYNKPFEPSPRPRRNRKTCPECGKVSGDGGNKHYATCKGKPAPVTQ